MNRNLIRIGAGAAALAAAGAFVHARTAREERAHAPLGNFLSVDGVRLHYIDEGDGPPLVLLHGLGSMVEDFVLSGLVADAARRYRVIAFDRPGYGHSTRPRRLHYGPSAQAALLRGALRQLDVRRPLVLAHSWGTLVALALALEHPGSVRNLVLESGLYFPSLRVDMPLLAPPGIPVIGDVLRHSMSPLLARALWPAWVKTLFAPAPVAETFRDFPTWMALRPSQLAAVGEETLFTLPAMLRLGRRYRELNLPVVLVAGMDDRYVSTEANTMRLHGMLPASRVLISRTAGHMVHHTDRLTVMQAIDLAS